MTQIEQQFMGRVPNTLCDIAENLDTRTIAAIMFGQSYLSGWIQATKKRPSIYTVAKMAVSYADALINELNKTK